MSVFRLNLARSLTGLPFITDSRFRLQPSDWNKFLISEQVIPLVVPGLRQNTVYRAFLDNLDVTALCKQRGRRLGDGLRTDVLNRVLVFDYFFIARESAVTEVERAAADAILVGGVRTLTIRSNDGLSVATVQLGIPLYARQPAEVIVKKTPSTNPNQVAQDITFEQIAGAADSTYYFTPPSFNFIQTFFADGDIVQKSNEVFLTSVDLFFRTKPDSQANVSGNPSAGVVVAICEVENGEPVLSKTYASSISYNSYENIFAFGDASAATTFSFSEPLRLETGKFYGIVVIFEDPAYELWKNVVGNRLINTNIPSVGVNSNKDGRLFAKNTSGVFNPLSNTDLKFDIKIARFVSSNFSKTFVNRDYEFFTVTGQEGNFLPGEYVWQQTTPRNAVITTQRGSPTITSNIDTFADLDADQFIVVSAGPISQVLKIRDVVSPREVNFDQPVNFTTTTGSYTVTVVGRMFFQNRTRGIIYLSDSTAIDATNRLFAAGRVIRGSDSNASATIQSINSLSLDRVRLRGDISVPVDGALNAVMQPTANVNGTFVASEANSQQIGINNQRVYNITNFDAVVLSRSVEVQQNAIFLDEETGVNRKSLKAVVDFTAQVDSFSAPSIESGTLDTFLIENVISNECDIDVNGVVFDTEVGGNGIALSKHIGVTVPFANERFAEDVRMFMTAYRPRGTELRAYVRLHNSRDPEAFDDKAWTPLVYVANGNRFSATENANDFVEYELGLPPFSEPRLTLSGTFSATIGSNVLTAADGSVSNIVANVSQGDVIRVYNPLFPNTNYQIGVVESVASGSITLVEPIETVNVAGGGNRIDIVKYPQIAFNNVNNTNIARYYNESRSQFDSFDSMQVKIVMLADNTHIVPRIDQIQVLGVSA